jgi:hypothetical protein
MSATPAEISALMTSSETVLPKSTFEALAAKVFTNTTTVEAIPAAIESGTIKAITAVSVVAVEPRTRADENSVDEPLRAVVAIWRTCVWIVSIVAVRAYRSWADDVCWAANTNADYNSLCVRVGC